MLKSALCILTAVGCFYPIGSWLLSTHPISTTERVQVAQQFVNTIECRPEPGERLAFLASLLVVPPILFGMSYVVGQYDWLHRALDEADKSWLVWLLFISLFLVFLPYCLVVDDCFHIRQSIFYRHPLTTLPLLVCSLVALRFDARRRWLKRTLDLVAMGLVLLVSLASVFDEGGEYSHNWHFTAAFNSVVQVHLGKALLIDCRGQYGLYAHFLQPIFEVTGLSVMSFTVVMAVLLGIAYLAIWAVMRGILVNRVAAMFGFAALVFASWFYLRFSKDGRFQWVDHYFQYYPIRFFFPAMLVVGAWQYFRRPGPALYWSLMLLFSVGVLWNFDSGLPTLFSWSIALCYGDAFQYRRGQLFCCWLKHLAAGILSLASVVSLYVVAISLRYGSAPDFSEFLHFQRLFYVSGFFMLPMEFPGTWVVVVLIYLGGLAYAARALKECADQVRAKLTLLLSVLGLGLFSYYQGRSHPYVLTLVWWPSFVLLAVFLDDILSAIRHSRTILQTTCLALVAWILCGFAWSAVADLGCLGKLIAEQFPTPAGSKAMQVRREAEYLRSHALTENEMVILAPWEPVLHLLTGIPALAPCSYIEMVLRDDYTDLLSKLEQRPQGKVYIAKEVFARSWKRVGSRQLIDAIQQDYLLCAETSDGYIFQRGERLFRAVDGCLYHFGFEDGRFPVAMESPPISFEEEFSIELIVNPDAVDKPWRVILSNHCGSPAHQGMMIFETRANVYELVCGTGSAWHNAVRFHVPPGQWSYLALTRSGNRIRAYVNGTLAQETNGDWRLKNSGSPLIIGDWLNHDCPFHGRIREVRIMERALTEEEIRDNQIAFRRVILPKTR